MFLNNATLQIAAPSELIFSFFLYFIGSPRYICFKVFYKYIQNNFIKVSLIVRKPILLAVTKTNIIELFFLIRK